jgi:hypothetical protein
MPLLRWQGGRGRNQVLPLWIDARSRSASANFTTMKARHLILAALVGLLSVSRADSILLSDDFSGATLDASKWITILPFGQSSITQAGGSLTIQGRGILATVDSFNGPYVINGAFTMTDHFEHFNIAFRTDLSEFGTPFGERSGMIVSFANDGDSISIQQFTEGTTDWYQLDQMSYALATGQTYFFSIFDDGYNVSLAINGTAQLAAGSAYATGGQIAFYSREFGTTATSIDAVTIIHVPETGVTAIYAALAMLGLVMVRKRQLIAS